MTVILIAKKGHSDSVVIGSVYGTVEDQNEDRVMSEKMAYYTPNSYTYRRDNPNPSRCEQP